jgi:outer membrane protein
MSFCLLLFTLALVLTARPSSAQDIDVTLAESAGTQMSIFGLGVGYAPDYEGSNDYEAVPLIQARINWQQGYFLSLLGNTLRANLVPSRNWHLGPVARYRMERDDVDDDRIDDMEEVDAAVELGVFGAYSDERWLLRLTVLKDVADGHDGSLVELGLGYKIPLQERGKLTLFATSTYADSDYMDAYFGIDAADAAASGLSTYDADSGFKDLSAGLAWQYNFNRQWGMLAFAKYTRLLGDAEDSPVVDDAGDAGQSLVGVVFNYRFGQE